MAKSSYKKFAKYLKDKSFDQTLHQARRESLERILANENEISLLLGSSKKTSAPKGLLKRQKAK